MDTFKIHTIESAPEQSIPIMQQLEKAFGFVPNVIGAIANSPVLLNALAGLFQTVHSGTFSEPEIQTLLLTNAVTNSCQWAVAFHTALALKENLDAQDVQAIREHRLPSNPRFAALSKMTKTSIESRGHLSAQDLKDFTDAGFSEDQSLEVFAAIAASTVTNYAGNIADLPLESQFAKYSWRAD